MSLNDHVTVSTTTSPAAVSRAGFGTPLVLSATAAWSERVRSYADAASVLTDFVASSVEYQAAAAAFAQSPAPAKVKIGRAALKPTQIYQLSAINPTANISTAYKVIVKGKGAGGPVTTTTVTFTSDASPTDAEFAAGMVTQLNAVVGKNYTAAGAASPITITATAPGDWFSIEVLDRNIMACAQTHVDPGVATDLAAITLEDSDWYGLHTSYNSSAYVLAAAAWCETNKKLYLADIDDTKAVSQIVGSGDVTDALKTLSYSYTSAQYHPSTAYFQSMALMGEALTNDPGSETWKFKTLTGVPAVKLTATERNNLTNKNGNSYEGLKNVSFTFDGKVASGNYIDVTRFLDWLTDEMQSAVLDALRSAAKIPFTDEGAAKLESKIRATLDTGVARGGLASQPPYSVSVPLVATVSDANKANRLFPDIKWSAKLAGAVHKAAIAGNVSV